MITIATPSAADRQSTRVQGKTAKFFHHDDVELDALNKGLRWQGPAREDAPYTPPSTTYRKRYKNTNVNTGSTPNTAERGRRVQNFLTKAAEDDPELSSARGNLSDNDENAATVGASVAWMNVVSQEPIETNDEKNNNVNDYNKNKNNNNSKKRSRSLPIPAKITTTKSKTKTTTTTITEQTFSPTPLPSTHKRSSSTQRLSARFRPNMAGSLLNSPATPTKTATPNSTPSTSPMKKKSRKSSNAASKKSKDNTDKNSNEEDSLEIVSSSARGKRSSRSHAPPPLPPPPLPSKLTLTSEQNGCFANAAAQLFASLIGTNVQKKAYVRLLDANYYRQLAYSASVGGEHAEGEQADTFRVVQQAIHNLKSSDFKLNHHMVVECALCSNWRGAGSKNDSVVSLSGQPLLLHMDDPSSWSFDQRLKNMFSNLATIEAWFCDQCVNNARKTSGEKDSSASKRLREQNKHAESNQSIILEDPAPKFIIIALPRFSANSRRKNMQMSHPTQFVTLSIPESSKLVRYELTGVALHSGLRISTGHWTCIRNNFDDAEDKNEFYLFDDQNPPSRIDGNTILDQINTFEIVKSQNRGVLFAYKQVSIEIDD